MGNNGCDSARVENDEVTCSVSSPYHPFLLHPCHAYQPSLFLPLGNQPPLLQFLSSGKTRCSKTHIPLSQVLYGNLLSSRRVIKILRDTRVSLQVTFDKMQEKQGRVVDIFSYMTYVAASVSAVLITLTGSLIPAFTISTYSAAP